MTGGSSAAVESEATKTPRPTQAAKKPRKPRVVSGTFDANSLPVLPPTYEEDTVILKLAISERTRNIQPAPDPYNSEEAASTFVSHPSPCVVSGAGSSSSAKGGSESAGSAPVGGDCMITHAFPEPAAPITSAASSITSNSVSGLRLMRMLTEFDEKCKAGEWPACTSVHCHWCCHRFCNVPFGLPIRYTDGMYHVVGCFCSLECASAANFASKESMDDCLNRYSLINSLAQKLGLGHIVKPAPDRVTLSMFGGPLNIDEFRATSETSRMMLVNTPPMQAVTQQVEEVHDSDMRGEYRFIPIDTDRVQRYQEKVRLRRTKPLIDFKNTLDHTMKLKITTPGEAASLGRCG